MLFAKIFDIEAFPYILEVSLSPWEQAHMRATIYQSIHASLLAE